MRCLFQDSDNPMNKIVIGISFVISVILTLLVIIVGIVTLCMLFHK
jgi:hypothetical protein